MSRVQPRVLKGFRDYLPSRMIPRQRMLASIQSTFERFGFAPLMTPALEALEILTGKYGGEGEGLLYRFTDLGGRDVALRYDLTVPLARVIAQYQDIQLPFRRYQIAPVWRAERPQRGRFREFVQCDADIVGSSDMAADAEIVELAVDLLAALGVRGYRIRLNNRKVLSGLMRRVGVAPGADEAGVLRTMDKRDKVGAEKMAELLATENGLSPDAIKTIGEFLEIRGDAAGVLAAVRPLVGAEETGRAGVEEVARVFEILAEIGLSGAAEIDLSIARGLAYYTGTIYEAFLTDLPGFGAVMGGGRYDGLIGVFKGEDIPAVGISLGIDRLLEGLVQLGLLAEESAVASVLVTVLDDATAGYAATVARRVRQAGISCELYPGAARLKKQLRHAERAGVRWVLFAGPEEKASRTVGVKDFSAERAPTENVSLEALPSHLLRGREQE